MFQFTKDCMLGIEQIDKEHRTYLQIDCIEYRVQAILYKDAGKEWHKPHRWEFSDF